MKLGCEQEATCVKEAALQAAWSPSMLLSHLWALYGYWFIQKSLQRPFFLKLCTDGADVAVRPSPVADYTWKYGQRHREQLR